VYRVGIIGCGFIGVKAPDSHLKAYQDCPDTDLVALCDLFPIAKELTAEYDEYQYYEDMVENDDLDIVSVCTPPETHCQIVCDIAPFVKAIYCEKPIALTLEEADKMIDMCHKFGVILQVNHQRRFAPVKVRFSNGILNYGSHMFDRMRQLFFNQWVRIEYIDTDENIFEIDCTSNNDRLIDKGVQHLVECLKEGKESISSGEESRKTLQVVLQFKEAYERDRQNPR